MKVKELIEVLKQFDENMKVMISQNEGLEDIILVRRIRRRRRKNN